MNPTEQFTFESIERQLGAAIAQGYEFMTCARYVAGKAAGSLPERTLVNRVDIDFSCTKARELAAIFNRLGVKGTFFVRLHAKEYNPFSFENYRVLKFIRDSGHEIGYHSEIVDQSVIWDEDAADCLRRDIDVLNRMLGIHIQGVASHGGMTGLNNLDFWKDTLPSDFGLLYEGYDTTPEFDLFNTSFYISDSEWTRWKCYDNGVQRADDRRSLEEHVQGGHPLIYLLIHPDTYFQGHFYE